MLTKSTRLPTGSVLVTFDGEVIGTRNGLPRSEIERFLKTIEETNAGTDIRAAATPRP